MSKKVNKLYTVPILLLLTLLFCVGFYFLPRLIPGTGMKQVDMLADIRTGSDSLSLESLRVKLAEEARLDSIAYRDSIMRAAGADSLIILKRDSLYRAMIAEQDSDSSFVAIEDFSSGHQALKDFFAALNRRNELGRPVRVAFLGDSFIEGDILVADVRHGLQERYGGRGVGFVPVTTPAAQFRATVETRAGGWKTYSILTNRKMPFTLSGMLFEPSEENAWVSLKSTNRYPELKPVNSFKFIYDGSVATDIMLTSRSMKDTLRRSLPETNAIAQFEVTGNFSDVKLSLTKTSGLRMVGLVMEDNTGVIVDNYSLRGNSGTPLARMNMAKCHELNNVRPYDLIILQYGLNVASDSMFHYDWYTRKMSAALQHLKTCFPEADILLLGVSDRCSHSANGFRTMPGVLALLNEQKKLARDAGIAFWNLFLAMGGEGSMSRYVSWNWASKDYTHISYRGGRTIAESLLKALDNEKRFYDEAGKMVE